MRTTLLLASRLESISASPYTFMVVATCAWYRITDGRIAENWHIEDNLTLQQQLEIVSK